VSVFLWVLQGLLAAAFGVGGVMKATQPKAGLAKNLPWVEDFSPSGIAVNAVLLVLAVVIAWGRFGPYSF
jgi:hypothetical protein